MNVMPKCPICKKPMSFEMLPIGTEKGEKESKLKMGMILPQVITWAIDTSIRAYIGSGRSLYLTCNNADCPACYKLTKPIYFKKGVLTPSLVGDSTGIVLELLKAQYLKKKKKKKK